MERKIVFQGTSSKGTPFIIRYPTKADAGIMQEYINTLSQERTFIRFQGEKISLEEETKYVEGQLEKIRQNKTVHLLVFTKDELIGIAAVDMKDKTESHEGVFGISLAKNYRGEGIGKTLMKLTLEEAEKNLLELRMITLGVFGDNDLARTMYESFGFKEYGRLPQGVLHNGMYVDHIYMYRKVS